MGISRQLTSFIKAEIYYPYEAENIKNFKDRAKSENWDFSPQPPGTGDLNFF